MIDLLEGLRPDVRSAIEASDLLGDPGVVDSLVRMVPKSRNEVLHSMGALGLDWKNATKGAEYLVENPQNEDPYGLRQQWRLDALEPNSLNEKIYGLSLGPERIRELAEDIKDKGQRVPIEVLADGTILDGHSRYLALLMLGVEMVWVVVVAATMTEAEVLKYIIDANRSQRRMSVREQVMVFQAELELARLGDPQNEDHSVRLGLDPQNEDRLSAKELRDESARRAGFRSYETARRARKVFTEGPEELTQKLDLGELSVNGAFKLLAAPALREDAKEQEDTTGGTEHEEEAIGATGKSDEAEVLDSSEETETETETETQDVSLGAEGDAEDGEEPLYDQEEEQEHPTASDEPLSVEDAVEVLAQHLEEQAASNYSEAKTQAETWFRLLFGRMKAARQKAA